MTGPDGGRREGPARTRRRWIVLGPAALAALAALVVPVVLGAGDRQPSDPSPVVSASPARPVPASQLAGEWSGEGSLTRCAGFEAEGCAERRAVALTIDCATKRCVVTPLDRAYGSPPLRLEDGAYRATGPVPPERAPTCGGSRTRSALWRLELTVEHGRLTGTYAESTIQGFDCGATGVAWEVTLERS